MFISLAHSTLFLKTVTLSKPGAYRLGKTSWPASSKDLLAFIFPETRLWVAVCVDASGGCVCVGAGDPNLDPP